ncbi:hypothetical protein GS629_00415 [Aeromonas veronii]|uniref:hypothetical protein n=1 Tax=Aeromonas veronii TaxID=654 RepID=UPI0013244CB3|nr:hypothetical protein [Aeromonas veronii]MCF5716794.1 hypothetical protein [Aeromonas veronii]MXV27225.1 hypothetical protein [Aeromonas veronii]
MDINISNEDLKGFNEQAKAKLAEAATEFIGDLIEESNRLESSRNTSGNEPEITSSMVNDARILIRRGLTQPKKDFGLKILRIAAAVLSLLVGVLYDSEKLQSGGYMLLFIGVITAAILTVTISTIKE